MNKKNSCSHPNFQNLVRVYTYIVYMYFLRQEHLKRRSTVERLGNMDNGHNGFLKAKNISRFNFGLKSQTTLVIKHYYGSLTLNLKTVISIPLFVILHLTYIYHLTIYQYSQTCVKRPYKTRQFLAFESYGCLLLHKSSALLSFSNKQPPAYSDIHVTGLNMVAQNRFICFYFLTMIALLNWTQRS